MDATNRVDTSCVVDKAVLDLGSFCSSDVVWSGNKTYITSCVRCADGRALATDGKYMVEVGMPGESSEKPLLIPREIAAVAARRLRPNEPCAVSQDGGGVTILGGGGEIRADVPPGEFPSVNEHWPSGDKMEGSVSVSVDPARLVEILRYAARHRGPPRDRSVTITLLPAYKKGARVLIEWDMQGERKGRALLLPYM